MARKLVAVYGTLKRGGSNYGVTEAGGGKFVGTAKTIHSYCMYGGWGFPRVTQDAPICPIHVEVFEMDSFGPMDSLEGHPTFFCRKEVAIAFDGVTEENDVQVAWMYFHPPVPVQTGTPTIIADGLWPPASEAATSIAE